VVVDFPALFSSSPFGALRTLQNPSFFSVRGLLTMFAAFFPERKLAIFSHCCESRFLSFLSSRRSQRPHFSFLGGVTLLFTRPRIGGLLTAWLEETFSASFKKTRYAIPWSSLFPASFRRSYPCFFPPPPFYWPQSCSPGNKCFAQSDNQAS